MDFQFNNQETMQMQQSQQSQPMQDQQTKNGINTVDFIRAKRREVEQRLQALLQLQAQVEGTTNQDVLSPTPLRENNGSSMQGMMMMKPQDQQSMPNPARSSQANATFDLTASNVLEQSMTQGGQQSFYSNNNGVVSNGNMMDNNFQQFSQQQFQQPQQAQSCSTRTNTFGLVQEQISSARVVSNVSLNEYVVSDRLAEILPDLDMSGENMPDMDSEGLMQFFQDSSAWDDQPNPALSGLNMANMNLNRMAMQQQGQSQGQQSQQMFQMPPPPQQMSMSMMMPSQVNSSSGSKQQRVTKKSKGSSAGGVGARKLGRPSAFPQKLYRMLMDIQQNDVSLSDIVGFTPDGSAFEIYQNDAFVTAVLPKYFKMGSYSSFQRQLQLYSFKRLTKGGAYHHPMFHRDQPDHVSQMVRKQSKPSTFVKTISSN